MPRFRVVLDVYTDDPTVTEDDISDGMTDVAGMLTITGPSADLSVDVDEVTQVDDGV